MGIVIRALFRKLLPTNEYLRGRSGVKWDGGTSSAFAEVIAASGSPRPEPIYLIPFRNGNS